MSDERTRFANVVLPHLGDAYALARWLARNDSDAEDIKRLRATLDTLLACRKLLDSALADPT